MEQEELDEYFNYETIIERMLEKIPDTLDKREGSIIYDAIAPAAAEIAQMYITLKYNIDLVFVDTAVDEYLDRLANQVGLVREKATKAIKTGLFYDENNNLMDIEIQERFTIDNLVFKSVEKISKGNYKMECETEGIIGNSIAGNLIPVNYIDGLGKAELTEILIPGEDEESDDSLRTRYYSEIGEKAFGGNVVDYQNKTKGIAGVGAVKVTPVWNGGGTVKLTILDSDYNKASNILIDKVQTEICPDMSDEGLGLAPIGHIVTVDTVEEIDISISTTITVADGSSRENAKKEINQAMTNYMLELRKEWEETNGLIVRKAQIETLILNATGVIDVTNTTINNKNSNIALSKNQIPILKEVVIS